jgi:hypothetical protein
VAGVFSVQGYSVVFDGTNVIACGNDGTKQVKLSSNHGVSWTNATTYTAFSSYAQSLGTSTKVIPDFQVTNTLYVTPGKVGINTNTPLYELDVVGNVRASNVTVPSDKRLKSNIETISNPLSTIQNLRGVFYTMNSDTTYKRNLGLIAQELQPILPEVVYEDSSEDHILSVNYAPIVSLLIEGMKELSSKYETLRKTLEPRV